MKESAVNLVGLEAGRYETRQKPVLFMAYIVSTSRMQVGHCAVTQASCFIAFV